MVTIATRAIEYGDFHHAKVILEGQQTGDYVLCLYYKDDSRKKYSAALLSPEAPGETSIYV